MLKAFLMGLSLYREQDPRDRNHLFNRHFFGHEYNCLGGAKRRRDMVRPVLVLLSFVSERADILLARFDGADTILRSHCDWLR